MHHHDILNGLRFSNKPHEWWNVSPCIKGSNFHFYIVNPYLVFLWYNIGKVCLPEKIMMLRKGFYDIRMAVCKSKHNDVEHRFSFVREVNAIIWVIAMNYSLYSVFIDNWQVEKKLWTAVLVNCWHQPTPFGHSTVLVLDIHDSFAHQLSNPLRTV